ncbi:MAG: FCD domain-containing protein [Solirubrobacteraceae bacterium]|nr:FCD domain-containing protein [Solirubrobacteraceae bacterium]
MRSFHESTWRGLPSDGAARGLREALIFGHFLPLEPLDPEEVALEIGASPEELPAAFEEMRVEGLAERLEDGTYRVAALERTQTIEFLEVLRTLGLRSYELGVHAVTDADLRMMREILRVYELIDVDSDPAVARMETFVFNRPVHEAHGNQELIRQLDLLRPRMERIAILVYPASCNALSHATISGVLGALERKEPDEALRIFRDGLDEAIRTIELLPDSAFEELAAT